MDNVESIARGHDNDPLLLEELKAMQGFLLDAWGIIANVSGGDWTEQTKGWQEAASRWRDNFHKYEPNHEPRLHAKHDRDINCRVCGEMLP